MIVTYGSNGVAVLCTDTKVARQELGQPGMKRLHRRIKELESADTWPEVLDGPGHWHPLTGDRSGTHAATVTGAVRIIVEFTSGTAVTVLDVGDVYKH